MPAAKQGARAHRRRRATRRNAALRIVFKLVEVGRRALRLELREKRVAAIKFGNRRPRAHEQRLVARCRVATTRLLIDE